MTRRIAELCRELNPGAQPAFLVIAADRGCQPNDCFRSVRRKVDAAGGRIQYGWAIWEWPNVFIEAEHHAVYEPPTGPPWTDITPPAFPDMALRLFLPDDTATYDFDNEGIRRDNVRRALADDPMVRQFFRLAEERTAIFNTVPGVGMVTFDRDASERLQRNVEEGKLVELHLAMKYTPKNARCFCGSGQKFKCCHSQ